MTLAELKAAIAVELKRGDMATQIAQTIKSVVLAEHAAFNFTSDAQGGYVAFDTALATQLLDYRAAFPLIRKIDTIYLTDVNSILGRELEARSGSSLIEDGVFERQNYWYIGGDTLITKTPDTHQYIYVKYFKFPDITDGTFTSWIVRDVPYYIVHKCAAKIMAANLGKADEAKGQLGQAATHFAGVAERIMGN